MTNFKTEPNLPDVAALARDKQALLSAVVAVTASGNTAVAAAPGASLKIVVLGIWLHAKTPNDYYFASASTQKSPTIYLGATSGLVAPNLRYMPIECAANEALNINALSAGTASVRVQYRIVPA